MGSNKTTLLYVWNVKPYEISPTLKRDFNGGPDILFSTFLNRISVFFVEKPEEGGDSDRRRTD